MPTAEVNQSGAIIYYEDSGPPEGSSTYTTVVIVHGHVFHGGSFVPLFRYAAAHNVRLICPNLRDYPGSSSYTPLELECLWSNDEEKENIALRCQGLEIAAFLNHVILTGNLPPVREVGGNKTGGLVLLSWSLGNVWSLAMFANTEYLENEAKITLEKQLRAFVMYEPPHYALGCPLPEGIYYPGYDMSVPQDQLPLIFARWVTAFHVPISTLTDDVHAHATRANMRTISPDPRFISTIEQLSPEQLASSAEPTVVQRSGRHLDAWNMKGALWNADRALFKSNGSFGNMDIIYIWCDMTVPLASFTAAYVKKRCEDAVADGTWRFAREVRFVKIEGGNHLIHLHEPERFLGVTVNSL